MNRRLALLCAGAALLAPLAVRGGDDEFRPLFNGKDLTGWANVHTREGAWHVENGTLVCEKAGGGWLRTDREYKDFVIKLDYKLPPGGNSGVFLRAPLEGDSAYAGLEIQILDHFDPMYHQPGAEIHPGQYTGSVYDVVPSADPKAIKPAGEWNSYEITHQGDHVKVVLNGKTLVDANLADYKKDHLAKHPGLARTQGYIGLQSHDSKVEFRNLMIKELK